MKISFRLVRPRRANTKHFRFRLINLHAPPISIIFYSLEVVLGLDNTNNGLISTQGREEFQRLQTVSFLQVLEVFNKSLF